MENTNTQKLTINPSFKYQNTIKRWLDDNSPDTLKYKLAVALLKGEKDPDERLGLKDDQYDRLLRSLEKIGGESPHEGSWRNLNYTTNEAEQWTTEALHKFFVLKDSKIYEVFIDEGAIGTRTIADFTTQKDAQNFIYEYNLKHPQAKLGIDTITSDFNLETNSTEKGASGRYHILGETKGTQPVLYASTNDKTAIAAIVKQAEKDLEALTSKKHNLFVTDTLEDRQIYNYANGGEVNEFDYMMLSRLQMDADYYLGNGNRNEKVLWALNVDDHIKEMKNRWNALPEDKKPEWLSMEDILEYEKKMKSSYAKGGEVREGDRVIITTTSLGDKYIGMNGVITDKKLLNNKYSVRLEDGMEMAFSKDEFRHNSINPRYAKGGEIKVVTLSDEDRPSGFTFDEVYKQGNIMVQRVGGSMMWNVAVDGVSKGRVLGAVTQEQAIKKAKIESTYAKGGQLPQTDITILQKGLENPLIPQNVKTKIEAKIKELQAEITKKQQEAKQAAEKPTLKDLEDRLKIVKKMATKKPELKARVKILEKMIAKEKKATPKMENGGETTTFIIGNRYKRDSGMGGTLSFEFKGIKDGELVFKNVMHKDYGGGNTETYTLESAKNTFKPDVKLENGAELEKKYDVLQTGNDSIIISDGKKTVMWDFSENKTDDFLSQEDFDKFKQILSYITVEANSFDEAYKRATGYYNISSTKFQTDYIKKEDIEILGVPRSKISEKEWKSILSMAKHQQGATFLLKDEKGLDVEPQVEYEWYVKDKFKKGGSIPVNIALQTTEGQPYEIIKNDIPRTEAQKFIEEYKQSGKPYHNIMIDDLPFADGGEIPEGQQVWVWDKNAANEAVVYDTNYLKSEKKVGVKYLHSGVKEYVPVNTIELMKNGGEIWGIEVRKTKDSPYEELHDKLTKKEADKLAEKYRNSGKYHDVVVEVPLPYKKGGEIKSLGFKQMDYERLVGDYSADYPYYSVQSGSKQEIFEEKTEQKVATWDSKKRELKINQKASQQLKDDLINWLKTNSYITN